LVFFCRLFPPSFSYLLPPLLSLQLFFLLKSFSSTSTMATAAPPPSVAGVARLSLPLRLLQICVRLRREHARLRRGRGGDERRIRKSSDLSLLSLILVITAFVDFDY
ncbi:hypothetical protein LINGRAPRIM_LOCUS28, partial [Linum grandiflorum]